MCQHEPIKNRETEFWNCLNYRVMTLSEQPPWCPLPHLGNKGVGLSSICFRSHLRPWAVADAAHWAIALVYLNCPISHSVTPRRNPFVMPGPRVLGGLSWLHHPVILWRWRTGGICALRGTRCWRTRAVRTDGLLLHHPMRQTAPPIPSAPTRCPVHHWLERAGQESRAS